jgi:carrier protein
MDALGVSLPDFASRMVGTSVSAIISSPMSVIRTLIQLGHEPIAPKPHVNFIGQNGFLRPGMIKYGKELVSTHGYKALFIGIEARLIEAYVSDLMLARTKEALKNAVTDVDGDENAKVPVVTEIVMESTALCGAIIVCHPFKVIGTNMIAQLVGGENVFIGIYGSLVHLYDEEGIAGWFRGLAPAIVGEIVYAISITLLTKAISEYVTPKLVGGGSRSTNEEAAEEQRNAEQMVSHHLAATFANPLFYPFRVVRTIMAVQGTGLAASRPPTTAEYLGWTDCFVDLWSMPSHRGLMRTNGLRRFSTVM